MKRGWFISFVLTWLSGTSLFASYQYRTAKEITRLYNLCEDCIEVESLVEHFGELITTSPSEALSFADSLIQKGPRQLLSLSYLWKLKSLEGLSEYGKEIQLINKINQQLPSEGVLFGDFKIITSRAYRYLNQYDKALNQLKLASEEFQQLKDTVGQVVELVNRGETYRSLGQYELAKIALQQAQLLSDNFNLSPDLILYLYNRKAAVFNEMNLLDSSLFYTYQALDLSIKNENLDMQASCHNELGNLLEKHGDMEKAEEHYLKAYELWVDTNKPRYWTNAVTHLARLSMLDKEYENAKNWILKGLELSQEKEWDAILVTYYDLLALIEFELGNPEKAFFYSNESIRSMRADIQTQINKELAVQQAQFALGRIQLELDLEKVKNQRERQQRLIVSIVAILLLIITVLIGIGLYFLRRKNEEISVAKSKVENALDERKTLLKDVHHRVKNNIAMLTALVHFQKKHAKGEEAKEAFEKIRERLEALSLVHKQLIDYSDQTKVKLEPLLNSLKHYFNLSDNQGFEISFEVNNEQLTLSAKKAISLTLILNELITNTLKHAYRLGAANWLKIQINEVDEKILVKYQDSGSGILSEKHEDSTGTTIVNMLSNQLYAKQSYSVEENIFELKFNKS